MKGLELSEKYFEAYGRQMLAEQFPEVMPYVAVGLFGSGSECFGFDDDISRDHDFEPGFCIFLPGEEVVDRRTAFLLERAYAKLPQEFSGMSRSRLAPVGGARHGVFRTREFFAEKIGPVAERLLGEDGVLSGAERLRGETVDIFGPEKRREAIETDDWFLIPETALAEATNGRIFLDPYGEVTNLREALSFYPENVRKKKLAGHLLLMAQAGQYNYARCLSHGETAAAQLAVFEFVKSAMAVLFLLNRVYQPFYKWSFKALRALPKLSLEAELLEYLLTSDNEAYAAEEKQAVIEGIAADVIDELNEQGLTKAICQDLEKHAYSVNDGIADATLRNRHILVGV